MYAEEIWKVLGIEPATSKKEIKKAYAAAIKHCHPEEKPEEYEQLKAAYETALKWTETCTEVQDFLTITQEEAMQEGYNEELFVQEEPPELVNKLQDFQEQTIMSELAEKVLDAFIQDFSDTKKRKDKKQWQKFFLQDDFLRVQFEVSFVEKLDEYLQQQPFENYYDLPTTLITELIIAYGLVLEDDGYIYTYSDWNNEYDAEEICSYIVANIWNKQNGQYSIKKGSSFLKKVENKARLDSFMNYHRLRNMAEHGYLVEERYLEWLDIIWEVRENNLQLNDDIKATTNYVPKRHECLLDLYGFLFENYEIPYKACKELYEVGELHNVNRKELSQKYIRIKNAILKQCSELAEIDMAHQHKEDYLRVTRKLMDIEEKYCYYDWIIEPDDAFLKLGLIRRKKNVSIRSQKEWETVEAILKSEDFLAVAYESGFCERLSKMGLSYCSAIQLYQFYKGIEIGKSFVESLFRKLEEYLLINECLIDVSESEESILQEMKDEVLAIFKEMGKESKELTLEAYDRDLCGFSVHPAENFKKCERVDVSSLSDEQKAAKLLEVLKTNRENAHAIFPHIEELSDTEGADTRSKVEKEFTNQYGYLNNSYIFLKYGTRNTEMTEKLVAMGIMENQDNLYEVIGKFHVEDYAFNSKSSSVVKKAKDTTHAVGWYWTEAIGMVPIMQGESQNFYGTRFLKAKVLENFEKYLVHVLYLEYVTQIIVCTGDITVECNLY